MTRLTSFSPYKFEVPWDAWGFAHHILHKQANLVIISMAWFTREDARAYSRTPKEPDMDTLSYWLARLEPLIRAGKEGEIICVFANRTGTEEKVVYSGTSAVLGVRAGEVKVYGILGRGEKQLLVVDTEKPPKAKLIPNSLAFTSERRESAKYKDTVSDKSDRSGWSVDTEIISSFSPADPVSPHAYFAPKGKKSSVEPLSPTFNRPASPKSRNHQNNMNQH